ncbi:MAG: glycosyltransferase family 4 protein [Prolixibacteraceae bacterium]
MKILYYLPSLHTSGGLERIITLKANKLAENFGYEVIILTSEQSGRKPYYPLYESVKHFDLRVDFDSDNKKSRVARFLLYPLKYYLFKKRFSDFLLQNKPDITISTLRRELNFINSLKDGSIKIGEFHVTRNAYHSGSITGNSFLMKIIKRQWGKLFVSNLKKLSKVILLTKEEVANWPELSNTKVIYNPLTLSPERASKCEEKKVIAVGRYAYQKGFDLLIEAWKIVNQKHEDWQLRIYGEGDRRKLNAQIHSLNLEDSCILEKAVKNIEEKYLESSIFVLSSRFEGFGMVIAEAMACGVPPVAFSCPSGPKDIITDGVDGILVEPLNIDHLAQKICYLIENLKDRKEMGKKAKINIERFNIENIMNQWKYLFESLLVEKSK